MGLMNIDKRRARNSPSFVKYTQLTQLPKRSASKIDGGVKHGLLCTGIFKELFRESNYWQEFKICGVGITVKFSMEA